MDLDFRPAGGGETILEARDVDVPGHVTGASLALRKGEILGIGGLVGAGRTELMEGLVGLRPRTGEVKFKDTPLPDGDVLPPPPPSKELALFVAAAGAAVLWSRYKR